ncbi:MAG: hypothetical protein ACXWUN_10170 [Allosphingosinicella sp.]
MHALLVAALLVSQSAPQERPCITPEEAGAMAVTLLPSLVDSVSQRCRPHLGAGAFLGNGSLEWTARLRRDAGSRRELALQGIGKIGGATAPTGVGAEATFDFFAQMMANLLASDLDPAWCGDIDTIIRSLAPLPSDNLAALVGATARLAATAEDSSDEAEAAEATAQAEQTEGEDEGPPICRVGT